MNLFTFRKGPSNTNTQYKLDYKEQFAINWINSIKTPQCLLVNDLNDENILNGNIFIDILIEFLSHYSIKTFKPDPLLTKIEKLKLLLLTLDEICKTTNKNQIFFAKKIKFFIENFNSIYDDKILLLEFFLLLKKFYEQYVNSISITTQSSLTSTENENNPKQNKINKNNLSSNVKLYNLICKNNKNSSFIKRNSPNNLINNSKKFSNSYENQANLNNFRLNKMNININSKESSKIYNEINLDSTKNNIFTNGLLNFTLINKNNFVPSINLRNNKISYINNCKNSGSTYRNKISLKNHKNGCFSWKNETNKDAKNNINSNNKTNINSNKSKKQPIKIIKQLSNFNSGSNSYSKSKNILNKNNIPTSPNKKHKTLRKNLIDFCINCRNSNSDIYSSPFHANLTTSRKKNLSYTNLKKNLTKNHSKNKYYNIIRNSQINLRKISNKINSRGRSPYEFSSNFSCVTSFINNKKNINGKNNKKILNWLIEIGAVENNFNETFLIQKISRGYFLYNLLEKIRERLYRKSITDKNKYIFKNPSSRIQIQNNFKYFWKFLSSFPGIPWSLTNLRRYEDKIMSKNEKIIFNLLNELYDYYNQNMENDI